MPTQLKPKHRRLCDRYLVHLNGARAAVEVGYPKTRARKTASEILGRPECKEYLARETKRLNAETRVAVYMVLEELAIVAFSDIRHFKIADNGSVTLAKDVPADAWRAVKAIEHSVSPKTGKRETKLLLWDKMPALQMAAQHLGMLKSRVEITAGKTFEDAMDEIERATVDARDHVERRLSLLSPGVTPEKLA